MIYCQQLAKDQQYTTQFAEFKKKHQEEWIEQGQQQGNQTKYSQFYQSYVNLIGTASNICQEKPQDFATNGITYSQTSTYQQFNFDIQRVVPNLHFYRLHIKISHFKLSANIAKYNHNFFQQTNNIKESRSKIQFIHFRGKQICSKIYQFGSKNQFHKKFAAAIKEWSILKICSVLKCSPYMQNYFGFDLILYNDSIHFAVEKGRQIKQITEQQLEILKQQLRIMHSFQIIHADIKPQNIIFSEHFNRPVFIDFGFSEIIQQKYGEQTNTSFKGTPNFCTPEMLTLMLRQNGYIDLYYNDAYGLKQTYKYMKMKENKILLYDYGDYCERSDDYQMFDQSKYVYYTFQYHYVHGNLLQVKQLLKYYTGRRKQQIKQILFFIKQAINHIFFPTIFYQCLKPFQGLVEYTQIKEMLKLNSQTFCLRQSQSQQMQTQSQIEENYLQNYHNLSTEVFDLQIICQPYQTKHYENYLKIILKTQKLQPSSLLNLISIVFQSTRFDVRNIDLADKVKVAKTLNPLFSSHNFQLKDHINDFNIIPEQQSNLKEIQILMRYILKYCLSHKPCKWIRDNIFDVFAQIILINDSYSLFINNLIGYLQSYQDFFEPILVIFQLKRLLQSAKMIKSYYINKDTDKQKKLVNFIETTIYKYQLNQQSSKDNQYISIVFPLNALQKAKPHNHQILFSYQQKRLKQIKNPHIRKYFLYQIFQLKIKSLFELGRAGQVIKIAEQIKRSTDMHNINLLSKVKLIRYLMFLSNNQMMQDYYKYIASVINCESVYKNLNIQRSSRAIKVLSSKQIISQIFYKLMNVLLNVEDEELKTNQLLVHKLINLYNHYYQFRLKILLSNQRKIQSYTNLFFSIRIQSIFLDLIKQTQNLYRKNLEQSMKQLQTNSSVQGLKLIYLKFKAFLYKYYYLLQERDYQQSIYYLEQISDVCKHIDLKFVIFQAIKALCIASWKGKNNKVILLSAHKLFKLLQGQ